MIGNSEPARNHGTIAIAGTRPMYSSALGTLAASVSAAPYIAIVNSEAAARNQRNPDPVTWKWIPRARATTSSTATWRPVIANATIRFPTTSSAREIGAVRSSRCAPDSRSTSTPMPANIVLSGISSPIVPVATKASYSALVCRALFSAGAITSAKRIGVSSGTTSSRGVRALSWKRRCASVSTGPSRRLRGSDGTSARSGVVAVIERSLLSAQAASASSPPVRCR